jgi:hypothetical protein
MVSRLICLLLVGCGFQVPGQQPGPGDAHTVVDGPGPGIDASVEVADAALDAPAGCIQDVVTATKSYVPAFVIDGTLADDPSHRTLVVPGSLPITLGNAGNHCAELAFKRSTDNALIRCRYQGGASVAHVGLNPVEIANGLRYVLDKCTLGAACPTSNGTLQPIAPLAQVPIIESVTVRIDNGDDLAGVTMISPTITRCP